MTTWPTSICRRILSTRTRLNDRREYDDTGYTITPWFNADEAETEKVALAIKAEVSKVSATATITIDYALDGAGHLD